VKNRLRRSSPFNADDASHGVAYSREFLTYIARILISSGHPPTKLAKEFSDICRGLPEPKREWNPARLNYVDDLPHVIARWHSDPQYVDAQGAPLALPVSARGPCLTELILRVMPKSNPVEVIQSLRELGGLQRIRSRYLPADRFLTFSRQQASAVAHGLTALLGMLRTLDRNISEPSKSPLFEKTAINPSFPVSALPAFHRQLRKAASEFIWSTDHEMRRRESQDKSRKRIRLGVGVFAFEDSTKTEVMEATTERARATVVRPQSRRVRRQ
jgi:hypothetical protein